MSNTAVDPQTRQALTLAEQYADEPQFQPTGPDAGPPAPALDYAGRDLPFPDNNPAGDGNLAKRAVRGGMWQLGAYGAQNVIRFASNIALTRLLTPDVFGLASITNTAIIGLEQLSDVGVTPSIVQNKNGETEPFLRTAFTIQVVRGILVTLIGVALAYPIGRYTGQPLVTTLLLVTVVGSAIGGFRSTAWARLQRRMRLAEVSVIQTLVNVISVGGVIAWAYVSPTAWALVIPSVLAGLFLTVISHFLIRDRRDAFGWDPAAARALFGFGSWVFVSTALTFFANSADRFLFAGMASMTDLGIYNIALSLATMPTLVLLRLGMSVVFPALAAVKDEPERFARAFGRVRLPMMLFGGYAAAGLIGSGSFFMHAVYPPNYAAAGWMVQILAVVGFLQVVQSANDAGLLATGRSKYVAVAHGCKFLALVAGIYFGLRWYGMPGAVFGVAAAEGVRYVVDTFMARRIGLRNFGFDGLIALWIAGSAAAGWAAGRFFGDGSGATGIGHASAAEIVHRVTPLLVSAAVVTLLWLPAAKPVVTWLKTRRKVA